jgi:hypothetical protein
LLLEEKVNKALIDALVVSKYLLSPEAIKFAPVKVPASTDIDVIVIVLAAYVRVFDSDVNSE